jgi:hypothetical protein
MNTTSDSGEDTSAANLDDEYAVSPYCRVNDDGEGAGDEWGGAWTHTNSSSIGNEGHYHFELSRLLQTKSSQTDQQILTPGETYSFVLPTGTRSSPRRKVGLTLDTTLRDVATIGSI